MDEAALGAIVRRNLALMNSAKPGGMMALLNVESIGGTGGRLPDGRTGSTANFFFDRQTGEIIVFNNPQYVPERARERYAEGAFHIANAFTHLPKFRGMPQQEIMGTLCSDGRQKVLLADAAGVSQDAKRVLRLTAEAFNATHR